VAAAADRNEKDVHYEVTAGDSGIMKGWVLRGCINTPS
jgi:hypothetical protein